MDLIEAVVNYDIPQIKTLLEQGSDPNLCLDKANVTALHFAAQNNVLEAIPLLITAGANIHARTQPEGLTPLDIANIHQHREMVALLNFYANSMVTTA